MDKMSPKEAKDVLQAQVRAYFVAAGITGKCMANVVQLNEAVNLACEALDLMDKQLEIEKKEE